MATFSFTRTREQMAVQVLEKLRVLTEGEAVNAADSQRVYDAIDQRLKELHALGILWFNVNPIESSLTLTAGVESANAASNLLYVTTACINDTGNRENLKIIDSLTFNSLEDKATLGQPESVFHANGIFYFNPIPDKAYSVKYTFQQIAEDTASNTAPDVEVSMLRALKNMVCYDLADAYSVPEQRIIRLAAEAADAIQIIRSLQTPKNTTPPRAKFSRF